MAVALSYIICAAGEGKRFQTLFGSRPKGLIRMHGRTLLEWSLRSLPIRAGDTVVIITQTSHRMKEKMQERVTEDYPFSRVVWLEIDGLTRGQLETASLAFAHVDPGSSLVIYNCDTYFESATLEGLMRFTPEIEGIIPCAEAEGESWSFCRIDAQKRVLEVREKERISSWASVGLYFFRDARLFFDHANNALSSGNVQKGEYYVAPLYQRYIDDGRVICADTVSLFKPMGTPEQISTYWDLDVEVLARKNSAPVMVLDLDNTITIDEPGVAYDLKKPNTAVIGKMREFARAGWEIIIHTSRRMETFGSDEARLLADVGGATLDWLKRHEVPFDGIRFGKPYARNGYYVDDKAIRPEEFLAMSPGVPDGRGT